MSVCPVEFGSHRSLHHLLDPSCQVSQDSAAADSNEPVAEHLKSLSAKLLLVFHKSDFASSYRDYMAEDFTTHHASVPETRNKAEHIDNVRRLLDANPNYRSEILNSSVEFKGASGRRAVVWNLQYIGGLRNGQGRESVAVLHWEKRREGWLCVRFQGLRGVGGYS